MKKNSEVIHLSAINKSISLAESNQLESFYLELLVKPGYRNKSKHELSAFFRRPGHKHYRDCNDQMLRNFLKGIQLKYRGDAPVSSAVEIPVD